MAKIKLTKGELKRQRDSLAQYERYLPTLQLKKQQLQMEILHQLIIQAEKGRLAQTKREAIQAWAGLLSDPTQDVRSLVKIKEVRVQVKNIAGIELPDFKEALFVPVEYDLFLTPLWVDTAVEAFKELISLQEEIRVIVHGIEILKYELRITTQRVNLFEKVKIPQAQEAIRRIKIYIGDQMANAVGRSKVAKRKIEALVEGALV